MPARSPATSPPSAGSVSVVRVRGLCVDYRTATGVAPALVDVDLDCDRGRLTVVAGPSGSGKSTLLRVLAGLHRPRAGSVEIGGVHVAGLGAGAWRRRRRRSMGIVLQNPADNLLDELTALEQVELAARLRGVDAAEATELLDVVGLAERRTSTMAQLSGGEQQRVAFAAAAIGRPLLLLADEPTAQLDGPAGAGLITSMRDLVTRGATLVASSHDRAVLDAADQVVRLRDGRVER